MWLCVDRIEKDNVILMNDEEIIYHLSVAEYTALTGRAPAESDILSAEVKGEQILSAAYDEAETASRKAAARQRLNRLFGKA